MFRFLYVQEYTTMRMINKYFLQHFLVFEYQKCKFKIEKENNKSLTKFKHEHNEPLECL